MSDILLKTPVDSAATNKSSHRKSLRWQLPLLTVLVAGGVGGFAYFSQDVSQASVPPAAPLAAVTVSNPLQRDVETRLGAIGQFSAINRVELRAQVGGTLSEIHFEDGQIVREGDLLFVVDPRPYEIKLGQAKAALESAKSRYSLATNQLERVQALLKTGNSTREIYDQRIAEQQAAQAAIDDAQSRIRDAQLDLEYTRVTAPFTGRIGARQVSIGGLVAGSRAATSPTTLLATLVSLDPIYLDFDMSEQDYLTFQRQRQKQAGPLDNKVEASLSDETSYGLQGALNFLDNTVNRSSGTIHARATFKNPDLFLAPGQFARVRIGLTAPAPALLVPDASVLADQSSHIVLTVSDKNVVVPKPVELGDLRGGLRVVRSGLAPTDRVIVDGIPTARPGSVVDPRVESSKVAWNKTATE
ncbi:efflux RND transporter periplasmic adaptor subunit [Mesorhizobium sp. YC-39]|uniref:efflux RND transporter periplasmic adaptor subunit n=1 Tax=unclassified Mesorhizobium TaxID=325217 RepID=UPI0021E97AB7|nr:MULTISPECIES: efflux RND transporter periplasmic adaptor subunit [unclassified Mesorhizobium]MCV3205671.1 efflux RND transporter periplasmic adaptor subunit [Mesorhizobium sp. YC-2]MCV3227930.1 efflux RND transporter periplasmic adaptor subunit [Mesorhizobium sp. YC-39]